MRKLSQTPPKNISKSFVQQFTLTGLDDAYSSKKKQSWDMKYDCEAIINKFFTVPTRCIIII